MDRDVTAATTARAVAALLLDSATATPSRRWRGRRHHPDAPSDIHRLGAIRMHHAGMDSWTGAPRWLHPHMGTITVDGRVPQAYMVALQHVVVTLDADPAWGRWWGASGEPACELGIVAEGQLDHLRPSADIRKVPGGVRATFTCAAPTTAARAPAELFPLAVQEVTGMFQVIREAIGLGALPPVPPLPELPEQAHDPEVTCKPLPPDTGEVETQGYLTLTQIQEFFGDEQPATRPAPRD